MDKETKKMLEDLKGVLDTLLTGDKGKMAEKINERLLEANKQPVIISIEKDKHGKATTKVEGERLAILLTRAGLENALLKKLNVPTQVWEMLKQVVDSEEAE